MQYLYREIEYKQCCWPSCWLITGHICAICTAISWNIHTVEVFEPYFLILVL